MRIWDLPVRVLCDRHLLAEHGELHAIWNIIVKDKRGYRNHPEVQRWSRARMALYRRHDAQILEFGSRGFRHLSNLDLEHALGYNEEPGVWQDVDYQVGVLRGKGCACCV